MARAIPRSLHKTGDDPLARTRENKKTFRWVLVLCGITVFQIVSSAAVIVHDGQLEYTLLRVFAAFIAGEWVYFAIARLFTKRARFEADMIAFFLSGISLVICASINNTFAVKQLGAIGLGVAVFVALHFALRDTERMMRLRMPAAFAAVGLLAVNLVLAETVNGALNWITVGPVSVQPSEFVKVAFVFVGAVTLEKLRSTQSLTKYVIFAVVCVGALFFMRDFGTALIFFFTFVLIAFMRSGDIRTIILTCAGALLGALLVLYFKPYVATRFSTYRRIWDLVDEQGFQQTRVLIYTASGGLFGLGIGQGHLRRIFAASTDLVFGVLCEEWGLLIALMILLIYPLLAVYAVRAARNTSSSFYAIAAVAAAGLLLFQTALNVFGVTDLLPLTGVTLPFVSRGGSSMISSWALLAFIKAAESYRFEPRSVSAPDIRLADFDPARVRNTGGEV